MPHHLPLVQIVMGFWLCWLGPSEPIAVGGVQEGVGSQVGLVVGAGVGKVVVGVGERRARVGSMVQCTGKSVRRHLLVKRQAHSLQASIVCEKEATGADQDETQTIHCRA